MTNTRFPVDSDAAATTSAEGSGTRVSIRAPPCATATASVRNRRRASCSVPPSSAARFSTQNGGPAAQTSRASSSPANQSLSAQQSSLSSFQWQQGGHAHSSETSSPSVGTGPVGLTPSPSLHSVAATGNPNGSHCAKSESWRDIVKHWNEGDLALGIYTPLKDWPSDWTRGNNRLFASNYQQRSLIALEFINRFHSDEASFLAAYPEAAQGHCALLRAISAARVARGEREVRALQNDQT